MQIFNVFVTPPNVEHDERGRPLLEFNQRVGRSGQQKRRRLPYRKQACRDEEEDSLRCTFRKSCETRLATHLLLQYATIQFLEIC